MMWMTYIIIFLFLLILELTYFKVAHEIAHILLKYNVYQYHLARKNTYRFYVAWY